MVKVGANALKVGVWLVIVLSMLSVPMLVLNNIFGLFGSSTIDRSGPAMLEKIRDLEEFTAAEASFTQVVDIEDDTFLPRIVAGERVTALVPGSVRASVNFGGLDQSSIEVDEASSTIQIGLPQPALSDADIDEKSVRFFRGRGLYDRIEDVFASNPTDDAPVFAKAEGQMNAAAEESELPARARANTEQWLRMFLGAVGFQTVTVNWQ